MKQTVNLPTKLWSIISAGYRDIQNTQILKNWEDWLKYFGKQQGINSKNQTSNMINLDIE